MKTKFLVWVLGALFTIPCVSRADEVEIPLKVGETQSYSVKIIK